MLLNLLKDSTLLAMAAAVTLPFLAFLGIIVFSRPFSRTSAALSIGAVTISLVSTLFLLFTHWDLNQPIHYASPWLVTGYYFHPLRISAGSGQPAHARRGGRDQFPGAGLLPGLHVRRPGFGPLLCPSLPLRLGHDVPDPLLFPAPALFFLGAGRAFALIC